MSNMKPEDWLKAQGVDGGKKQSLRGLVQKAEGYYTSDSTSDYKSYNIYELVKEANNRVSPNLKEPGLDVLGETKVEKVA